MRTNDAFLKKDVCAQIDSVPEWRSHWLSFPAELEERFENDRKAARSRNLRIGIIIALAIFDLFLFCDARFLPDHFVRCVVLRLTIVTPLLLVAWIWLGFDPPKRIRETITLLLTCIVGFTTLYLWHGVSGVATAFAQTAMVLLILFVNTMMRLRFFYAVPATLLSILDGALFLRQDHWLNGPEKITSMCLLIAAAIFTLIANYWMEREERIGYLLRAQVEKRRVELAAANRELTWLSNLDGLTGLANRRHFDMSFAETWEAAIQTREAISLLLIDIDNFKKINDEYGHLYGDEVLVHVGRMFREGLRNNESIVARYGGEEFVVLLPGMTLEEALITAERLRRLAWSIEIPARQGMKTPSTTISIGAATAEPASLDGRAALLHEADLALYAAKTHGRNQVWAAKASSLQTEIAPAGGRQSQAPLAAADADNVFISFSKQPAGA